MPLSMSSAGLTRLKGRLRKAVIARRNAGLLLRTGQVELSIATAANLIATPIEGGWRVTGDADDPQIHLEGTPRARDLTGPFIFQVDLAADGGRIVRPFLYVDLGDGFSDQTRIGMRWSEGGSLVAHIPDMGAVRGLRFDPSEGACVLTIRALRLRRPTTGEAAQSDDWRLGTDVACALNRTVDLSGLRIQDAHGLALGPEPGDLLFTDHDPQILLSLLPETREAASACRIVFQIEADRLTAPCLWIRYGAACDAPTSRIDLARHADGLFEAIVAFPAAITSLRWDPSSRVGRARLLGVWAEPLTLPSERPTDERPWSEAANAALRQAAALLNARLNQGLNSAAGLEQDYELWRERHATFTGPDHAAMRRLVRSFRYRPKFSFILPVYRTPPDLLEACLRSLLDQVYENLEVCVADDCSGDPRLSAILERFAREDDRVRFVSRSENGHISAASNSALALASGDYVVLVDHDDIIPDYSLLVVADTLQSRPEAKILYSDEDKLTIEGRHAQPHFKPDFDPFLLYGLNMVSHLGVYRRDLVESIDGFRIGYEGSQDYDLLLRCLPHCAPGEIVHINHVLYHWRMIPGSTAVSVDQKDYAVDAAKRALNDHFERLDLPFRSVDGFQPGVTALQIARPPRQGSLSIVIPTRDRLELLEACYRSLETELSDLVELIIVDNGSIEAETLAFLDTVSRRPSVRVIRSPGPFNFSTLCNLGVEAAQGELIGLLNNDTERLSPDWLARVRTFLDLPHVGVVGGRLLYPDNTIQAFGLHLGQGTHGVAVSAYHRLSFEDGGDYGKARLVQEFSATTAACLFVKKEVYLAVGGFDPELAVAYNDVDFCLKVRRLGLKIIGDPEIVFLHRESASRGYDLTETQRLRLDREAALMRQRWSHELDGDPFCNPNLSLGDGDTRLAAEPRQPWPWRRPAAKSSGPD